MGTSNGHVMTTIIVNNVEEALDELWGLNQHHKRKTKVIHMSDDDWYEEAIKGLQESTKSSQKLRAELGKELK